MVSHSFRAPQSRRLRLPLPRSLVELVRQASAQMKARALYFLMFAWLPVVILCAFHGLSPLKSFLTDFGAQSRFLIVIPLFVLAEPPLRARLEFVARHFVEESIVVGSDKEQFAAALEASERFRDSKIARIVLAAIVYGLTLWMLQSLPSSILMPWSVGAGNRFHLSGAGIWSAFVSYPILLYLLLLWIWRQLLWAWFLHRVCKLQLRLVASHPDHCAGLAFLRNSLVGQMPFSFSVGTIAAGGWRIGLSIAPSHRLSLSRYCSWSLGSF